MGLTELCIVTLDGPAGAGKSSVARAVARSLDYTFLDTGAMYRAIAYGAVRLNIGLNDEIAMEKYLDEIDLIVKPDPETMRLVLNGRDITHDIRTPDMGKLASDYSTLSAVRTVCSRMQRQLGEKGKIVCEGRDMGTVVFPDAKWKFFLTASVDERAQRRYLELKNRGEKADINELMDAISKRDAQDSGRKIAPLKPADDALIIDTTTMPFEQVVNRILEQVNG